MAVRRACSACSLDGGAAHALIGLQAHPGLCAAAGEARRDGRWRDVTMWVVPNVQNDGAAAHIHGSKFQRCFTVNLFSRTPRPLREASSASCIRHRASSASSFMFMGGGAVSQGGAVALGILGRSGRKLFDDFFENIDGLVLSILKRAFELCMGPLEGSLLRTFEEGGMLITERPRKRLSSGIDGKRLF